MNVRDYLEKIGLFILPELCLGESLPELGKEFTAWGYHAYKDPKDFMYVSRGEESAPIFARFYKEIILPKMDSFLNDSETAKLILDADARLFFPINSEGNEPDNCVINILEESGVNDLIEAFPKMIRRNPEWDHTSCIAFALSATVLALTRELEKRRKERDYPFGFLVVFAF